VKHVTHLLDLYNTSVSKRQAELLRKISDLGHKAKDIAGLVALYLLPLPPERAARVSKYKSERDGEGPLVEQEAALPR
jgi:hypothetical protein